MIIGSILRIHKGNTKGSIKQNSAAGQFLRLYKGYRKEALKTMRFGQIFILHKGNTKESLKNSEDWQNCKKC